MIRDRVAAGTWDPARRMAHGCCFGGRARRGCSWFNQVVLGGGYWEGQALHSILQASPGGAEGVLSQHVCLIASTCDVHKRSKPTGQLHGRGTSVGVACASCGVGGLGHLMSMQQRCSWVCGYLSSSSPWCTPPAPRLGGLHACWALPSMLAASAFQAITFAWVVSYMCGCGCGCG